MPSHWQLSEYFEPLASLRSLKELTFPCNYLETGPIWCYHDAKELEKMLLESNPDWRMDREERESVYEGLDPDAEIYRRLLSSGLLITRPHVRLFVDENKADWLTLAKRVTSLESIVWSVYHGDCDEIGAAHWSVGRDRPQDESRTVSLHDRTPEGGFDRWVCSCEDRGTLPFSLEEHLESLPPLFKQEADFKPAYTLDRFVSRS